MAADLDAVPGLAVAVGGVDDAYREPQHAPLDLLQHVQIHARDVVVANLNRH